MLPGDSGSSQGPLKPQKIWLALQDEMPYPGAMTSQSIQEKRTLDAIWKAHPTVIAFTAAVTAHVAASDLTGLEAMNDTMRFASAWISAHGPLPDSGILCD